MAPESNDADHLHHLPDSDSPFRDNDSSEDEEPLRIGGRYRILGKVKGMWEIMEESPHTYLFV